jgi:hypothetical protein
MDNDKIEIYNVYGQLIYSNTMHYPHFNKLNASLTTIHINEPDGVYFFKISDDTGAIEGEGKFIVAKFHP